MTRITLAFVAFFLLCVCLPAQITLEGPTEPVDTGEYVQVMVRGLADSDLPSAMVTHWPRERTNLIAAKTWGGDPFIWFMAKKPDKYLLQVMVARGDTIEYAEIAVVVGGVSPDPAPDPDPNPDPTPDPLPEPGVRRVVIIEEGSQRTPQQAMIYGSPVLRSYIKNNNHQFLVIDKDADEGHASGIVARLSHLISDTSLPVLVITDDNDVVIHHCPLPADTNAVIKTIKEYGG